MHASVISVNQMTRLLLCTTIVVLPFCAIAKEHDYGPAMSKVQEAAYIQTGAKETAEKAKAYGLLQAEHLGVAKPLGVTLYCIRTYRDKAVSLPVGAGKRLTLKADRSANLSIDF